MYAVHGGRNRLQGEYQARKRYHLQYINCKGKQGDRQRQERDRREIYSSKETQKDMAVNPPVQDPGS